MINTLKRAMARGDVAGDGILRDRSTRAGTERSATRRHQVAVPLRLYGALRQHPAGRRSFAAMPAEEHVEPFGGLRERRAAVEPPAAPKAEVRAGRTARPNPRRPPPKTETAPPQRPRSPPLSLPHRRPPQAAPAKQPTSAQIIAIRSACRSDYPKVCAGVPTGGAPALQCLEKNKAKLSAACGQAVGAASGGAAPAAGAVPAAATGGSRGRGSRRSSCCGRCGRAKNCSCCGRPAAPMSARCAAALRPAAAASCSAWPPTPPRFRRPARKCWASSPRNS